MMKVASFVSFHVSASERLHSEILVCSNFITMFIVQFSVNCEVENLGNRSSLRHLRSSGGSELSI